MMHMIRKMPLPFPLYCYMNLPFVEKMAKQVENEDANSTDYKSLSESCDNQADLHQSSQEVACILIAVLRDQHVEGKKLENLNEEQRKLVKCYLKFVLVPSAVEKMVKNIGECWNLIPEEFVDLSKRKDETLKKVLSVALKVIYREFLTENKINQSLNPRKYVKRAMINARIFQRYFGRESEKTKKRQSFIYEHSLLFFIKEGVTEEWFEAIIGIRNENPKHKKPCLKFLKKIIDTLKSEQLIQIYRSKIESMVKKTFYVRRKSNPRDTTEESFPKIIEKLENASKKPKIALSICQFKNAINIATMTIEKYIKKYNLTL